MAAALETFNEPKSVEKGIFAKRSTVSFVRNRNPGPSAPRTRAVGLLEISFNSVKVVSDSPSNPTHRNPIFLRY